MFSRAICIFLVILLPVFVTGYVVKSSSQPASLMDESSADLVQRVLSCPCKIGPLGLLAGRGCSKKTREAALNILRARHPDWHWELIAQNRIKVGMNEHELRLAWGNPYTVHCSDDREQWVHVSLSGCLTIKKVYVEKGQVAAWM